MGEISLRPWRRYGHDRVYASADGGYLGFLNRLTGEVVLSDDSCRDAVVAALVNAGFLAAGDADPVAAGGHGTTDPKPAETETADRPMTERSRRRQEARRNAFANRSWHRPTLSEKALADELVRSSPFTWQREVPWDQYRLDFYCAAACLAVEVDGSSHRRKREADAERDAFFRAAGVETERIPAEDVERDCAAVVARLNRRCIERTGTVPPTEVPAPGLVARLLGRTQRVARPAMAPPEYRGTRRGDAFVCARCRTNCLPAERSTRATNCCVRCAG